MLELQKSSLITVDFPLILTINQALYKWEIFTHTHTNQQNNSRLQPSEALNSPSVMPGVYKQNIYQLFPYSPQKPTVMVLWYLIPWFLMITVLEYHVYMVTLKK